MSVRIDRYSMGATIDVTIKRDDVRISDVAAIAEPHQDGCIYVTVSYDESVWMPLADKIQACFNADGATVKLGGVFVWQEKSNERWYCIDSAQNHTDALVPDGLARMMAKAVLNGRLTDLCLAAQPNAQVAFLAHLGAI